MGNDMILVGQIASVLKHTKAKDLMESILNEANAYYNDLKVCGRKRGDERYSERELS